ncbi:MAG TPA: PASTA domain-containing protein [Candidatus Limnocylindria bacterium]
MGSPAEGTRDALPGKLLGGRYLIEREVARDEDTLVYEARDERLDRPVAIKVLAAPQADDPARVRSFLDEARRAASDASVAQVYDSGEDGGVPFIVMELRDVASAPADPTTTVVTVAPRPEQRPPSGAAPPGPARRRTSTLAVFGLVVLLAACALIAAALVTGPGRGTPPADATSRTPSARPTKAVAAGKVKVPSTIGMSEDQAEQIAGQSGLAWRLEWRVDPSKPAGVYDQDPAAGTVVDDGAPFVMYAYRTK